MISDINNTTLTNITTLNTQKKLDYKYFREKFAQKTKTKYDSILDNYFKKTKPKSNKKSQNKESSNYSKNSIEIEFGVDLVEAFMRT